MNIADSDRDEPGKAERLREFFDGATPDHRQRDLNNGVSDGEFKRREAARHEALLAELDDLGQEAPQAPSSAPTEAEEPAYERVDHAPALTPYDKAREAVTEAEIWRDAVEPGSDEYHRAMADLAEAKRMFKVEQSRATDEGWRKRRATDEWRAGEGREEYNTSRRDKDRPNTMTPKDVLDAMTPEERAQHVKDQKADSANRARAKAKFGPDGQGLTGAALTEAVEVAVEQARARRLAKRACA